MRRAWAIAGKELRTYFDSPVAVLFLATFLAVTLFAFFWGETFFARETADVRPLFEWLPILLIFLVSSISMRAWSEERKSGTIEILSTLPIPTHQLVLGKFLAGMALVGIALLLTLGIPITVSMMGDLDWGPVWGGYLAAMLLASAYLSIGLAISATTENGIVALLATAAICVIMYLPGSELALGWVSAQTRSLLEALGVGSRFSSVARGVLDLRDLVYYVGLVTIGIAANILILASRRWSTSDTWQRHRQGSWLAFGLILANVILLSVWLHPIRAARADLTEDGIYSLSDTTKSIVRGLEEPLTLRGYFSEKTHPLLAPLVPQIEDMMEEYAAVGGANVSVSVMDPTQDVDSEKEAYERYNIRTMPVDFEDRYERSTVNAYFHVLVAYGDQYAVLDYTDLLDMQSASLRDLEYTMTRTIRRVVNDFQSKGTLLTSLSSPVEMTAFMTPQTLPENWSQVPEELEEVAAEISQESSGKVSFSTVEPHSPEEQQKAFDEWGIRPYATSVLGGDIFYLHLVLKVGDRRAVVAMPEAPTQANIRDSIESAIERLSPGFATVVGLWVPEAKTPPRQRPGMPPQQPRPEQSFETLKQVISAERDIESVSLSSGRIPENIEVLLIAGRTDLSLEEQKAVDQFLMMGGSVVVLAGHYRLNRNAYELSVEKVEGGLFDLLSKWGVKVADTFVLDPQSDVFPIPVKRNVGGLELQEIQRMPFPPFIQIDGSNSESPVTRGLGPVVAHFASPIQVDSADGIEETSLMNSSDKSWQDTETNIEPDFSLYPESGFDVPKTMESGASPFGPKRLAVALRGSFKSAFAGEDTKQEGAKSEKIASDLDVDDAEKKERPLLQSSPPDARLIVVGSSDFVSDTLLGVSQQAGSSAVENNLNFVQNTLDWATLDPELLSIRARSGTVRPLKVEPGARLGWEIKNYLIALLGLAALLLFVRFRRTQREIKNGAYFTEQKKQARGGAQ